ncbi:hypothetical protein BDZ89DRAFT_1066380 [Hymenopellis radicata]|nr:hypothetical protein BDZ89DRAFT_1066380 [Hymenopellis radicata]
MPSMHRTFGPPYQRLCARVVTLKSRTRTSQRFSRPSYHFLSFSTAHAFAACMLRSIFDTQRSTEVAILMVLALLHMCLWVASVSPLVDASECPCFPLKNPNLPLVGRGATLTPVG